jgi:L-ribulose-5-phosphate 3-epimerase
MLKSIITDQISMDLETALQAAQQAGFDAVELHGVWGKTIEDCSMEEVNKIKQLLTQYQLKVSNLATTIFLMCPLRDDYQLLPFHESFVVTKAYTFPEHLDALQRAIKIAKELQCPNIRIFPFRYPENYTVVGTTADLELISQRLTETMTFLNHQPITLVIENCPYSHCPKVEMTNQLVTMLNHPQIKLLYDPGNSYRADKHRVPQQYLQRAQIEEIPLTANHIQHIHLKNYHYDPLQIKPFIHKTLNQGDLDYYQIISQLQEYQVSAALSLEPEVTSDQLMPCIDEFMTICAKTIDFTID